MCLFEISGIDMVRLLAAKKLFGGGRCGVLGDKIVTPIIHKGEAKPAVCVVTNLVTFHFL